MEGQSDVEHLKRQVQTEMDRLTPDLFAVSRFLHANPELAYEEHQAVDLLTDSGAVARAAAEFRGQASR